MQKSGTMLSRSYV